MTSSIDVLFLVPPMKPILRPLDIIYNFFNHSKNTRNIISVQLGLLSIAGNLLKEGFSCQYHDLGHFKGKKTLFATISDLIRKYNPKIVALTSYTSNFNATLKVVDIVKEIDPNNLICVGGPHVTFLDKISIDESNNKIDVVVRGEGEQVMRNLVYEYLKNSSIKSIEENVQGITTKNKRNADQKLLSNEQLDELPLLPLDLIPQKERTNFIYIPLSLTRGCSYKCTFCTNPLFWRRKVRFRSPEKVIEDILFAEKLFPKRLFEFTDTILPYNVTHFENLVHLYKKLANTPIKFALTRANLTDNKRLHLMKLLLQDEGFVSIGVENGNQKTLDLMGKPSWEIQYKALRKLKSFGLASMPTWMIGFCGENISTMNENLQKLEYLNKEDLIFSAIMNIWIPLPGSLPFLNPKKFGVKIHSYNWDFYDRGVFPPPYSLFDLSTGEITLSDAQIWSYYLSMVALQNKWSNKKHFIKGRKIHPSQFIKTIIKDLNLLFFPPGGESNNTIYEDLLSDYRDFFNPFKKEDKEIIQLKNHI